MTMEKYEGFYAYPIEQWSQFFERCNWYTFNVMKLEFEDDRMMGGVEATFILLGIGVRLRWNYKRTEKIDEIQDLMREAGLGDND